MKAPLPENEERRLEALRRQEILDSPPEPEFDDLVELAASLCGTPMALISLVDENRQWFKARVGVTVTETSRDIAFCAHGILKSGFLVVSDATKDARFADNPLVLAEPRIRFYAGAPLVTEEGLALGMLCVLDRRARRISRSQREGLAALARVAARQIAIRRWKKLAGGAGVESKLEGVSVAELETEVMRRRRAEEEMQRYWNMVCSIPLALTVWRLDEGGDLGSFELVAANPAAARVLKAPGAGWLGKRLKELYPALLQTELPQRAEEVVRTGQAVDLAPVRCGGDRVPQRDFAVRILPLAGRSVAVAIEDITDRRLAEQAQLENQARKAAILDSALDAIVTLDHEGNVFEWNPAAERMFGVRRAAALGKELARLVFPESEQERFREALQQYQQGRESVLVGCRVEMTARRSDGREFPVELSVTRVPKEGLPIFTGFIRDITERRQFEETLRRKEATLLEAQRIGRIGSWELDLATNRFEWSEETYRILGQRREATVPSPEAFLEAVHPDDRERVRRCIERALQGLDPYRFEHRILTTEGTQRVVLQRAELVYDRDRRPVRWLGTVQDITERKQAEEAVRASQGLYSSLVESMPQCVFRKDARLRFTFANSKLCQTVGRRLEEVIGRTDRDFFPETFARRAEEDERRVLKTGEFRETIEETELPGLGRRMLQVLRTPIMSLQGEIIGLQGMFWDITDRQQLEEQLRQAQKMETIGQLAGGVAHDFNNLLTVIQGHASILLAQANLSVRQRNSLQQISTAAERAAHLTRQLLTFSRKQVLQPRHLDLNEVVLHLSRMLRRTLGEDVHLDVALAPDLPAIHADPVMLEQALLNLAVNSRDAMPEGGQLTVSTSTCIVDEAYVSQNPEASAGPHVRLTVTDTGCGIKADHLPHIFEPFFTTKDVGKGTGLGLATVYGIVRQHRGWVTVESEVGKGTTFHLYLPVSEAPPREATEIVTPPAIEGGRETILVVEDEDSVRELVRGILEERGYVVLEARSGKAALEIWGEHRDRIDLLLTDIVMPEGISGRDLGRRLVADKPSLKVIYSSGYSPDAINPDRDLREGTNFLPKPFVPQRLVQMVRSSLDS